MDDERFDEAVRLFNDQEYFACHDVLEEIWSETIGDQREYLQGLIHAAVALFHFSEGNLGGARKMHDSATDYLQPYTDQECRVDLQRFLKDFDHCFEPLLGAHQSYPHGVHWDESRIPKLTLTN